MKLTKLLLILLFFAYTKVYSQSIALDTTWADQGFASILISNTEFNPENYHVAADGSILIAGSYVDDSDFFEYDKSMIMKLDPDGNLDAGFGINGIVQPELYYDERHEFFDITILANGKIRTGGFMQSGQGPGLSSIRMQFNSDGSLDTDYGTNGLAENYGGMTTGQSITDFYEGNDGVFYEAGTYFSSSFGNFAEIYIFRNGGFIGGPGDAFSYTSPNRGYVNSDNDFYLGLSFGGEDPITTFPAIVKYAGDAPGQDPAFDGDGRFDYMVNGVTGSYRDISGSLNGEIIAIGTINDGNTSKGLITKMLPDDGGLDMDFGDGGHLILEDEDFNYFGNQIHYIESANVYLARIARTGIGSGLMAFYPDGSPVENFGINGTAWYNSYLDSTSITSSTLLDDETLLLRSSDFSYFVKLKIDFAYQAFQETQALLSSDKRLYKSGERIISVQVEESEFDGDSLLRPFSNWYYNGFECYDENVSSVLGKEVRISNSSGLHEFITGRDDTIQIFLGTFQAQPWIAYSSPDGEEHIEAAVDTVQVEDVLGISDLVKRISFQKLDSDFNPIDDPVNNWEMKHGAQSGLISFPDFSNFPDNLDTPMAYEPMFELVGKNELGEQDLSTFDVFDFQVGDEIHIEVGFQNGANLNLEQFAEEVLARTDYPDSIVYELEIRYWTYNGPSNNVFPELQSTTLETRTIVPDTLFDLPVGRPLISAENGTGTFTWLEDGDFGMTKNYPGGLSEVFFFSDIEACYTEVIDWQCTTPDVYISKLGGPYYFCEQSLESSNWRQLNYFNVGGEEWGEPLSINSQDSPLSILSVYPNPARNEVRIGGGFVNIKSLDIYTTDGRLINQDLMPKNEGAEYVVDVSYLPPGVYILRAEADGINYSGRLLIVD